MVMSCIVIGFMGVNELFNGFNAMDVRPSRAIAYGSMVALYVIGVLFPMEHEFIIAWLAASVMASSIYMFRINERKIEDALATMLGIIGSINGVATVAAPIAGGFTAGIGGWKGIFWCLMALGAVLLAGSVRMKESLSGSKMKKTGKEAFLGGFKDVLHNRKFVMYVMQYGFTMAVLFTNVASAPFIMQEHYGISPMTFSLVFAVNAIAMAIATALAPRFRTMEKALRTGSDAMLLVSILLCGALMLGCSFWIYEILLFLLLAMVGMSFTASNSLAMESEHSNAGIASALLGTAGYAFGGIVPPLAGLGNMMVSAGVLFIIFALLSCVCARAAVYGGNMKQFTNFVLQKRQMSDGLRGNA